MFQVQYEKVGITVAAYVIGFTTAFIAYGIGERHVKSDMVTYNQESYVSQASAQEVVKEGVSITLDEKGLYVYTPEGNQLLSANREPLLSANAITADSESSGIHYAIIDAELSRAKGYVYFCEQLSPSDTTCDPYIYTIEDEVLVPVTVDNEKYYPEISSHASSWAKGELLSLNDHISLNGQSPWKLIAR